MNFLFTSSTSGSASTMNLRQGIGLLVVFTIYLLIGGAIFMVLEKTPVVVMNPTYEALILFKNSLMDNTSAMNQDWTNHVNLIFENITEPYVNKSTTKGQWSFYDSTFFCLTVVTSIGYGSKYPTTESSRGFCIIYALIGIPLTGIWMAGIGHYFSKKLLKAHEKTKTINTKSPKIHLVINTITYLIPGMVIFLIMPAAVFMAIEDWTYLDSFYYAVITLTTIGFGDFVAGTENHPYNWAYKIGIMIWIIFGLGYLSMILNFIAKAMKSKHLKNFERSLTRNLKQTQDAFAKEVDYLIKTMNEMISRKHEIPTIKQRRSSFPMLDIDMETSPKSLRRSLSQGSISMESSPLASCNDIPSSTENPANFVFNLAMAIACGNINGENGSKTPPENAEKPNNVAQLLTMALLPQLRRANSVSGASTPHQKISKTKSSFPAFDKMLKKEIPKNKAIKSNSVVGNFLFPFGINSVPSSTNNSTEDVRQARMSESKPIDHDGNIFKNMMKRQLERSESNPFNFRRGNSAKKHGFPSDAMATTSNWPKTTDGSNKLTLVNDRQFLDLPRRRTSSNTKTNNLLEDSIIITVTEEEDFEKKENSDEK